MMVQRISEILSELQNFLNNSYDYFLTKFCQLKTPHRFEIKQELISGTLNELFENVVCLLQRNDMV